MAEKKKAAVRHYRVLNPRGIPAGIPVVSYWAGGEQCHLYEGNVADIPENVDSDGRLLRDGFIEEVAE